MRTPDVAARNVVVMAGSTVRTVGERLGRCRGRARAPAGRQPGPWRSLPNATMPISHRPPPARVAVVAPPRRRDYVSSPRRLASARRLTGVVATEATTPRRRVRHAAHRRVVERVGLDRQTTPDSRHRMPRLGYSERRSTRRAVKRSTARRSTAGSTAIREHAVTAVGIRTNETLRHTFRTGRRAAATRATHGRAGEAPPTVCQQPARVVRDESWDESWAPYYNLYAGTPRDSSGTNGASGCQPRNQDTQVHILCRLQPQKLEFRPLGQASSETLSERRRRGGASSGHQWRGPKAC